MKNLKVLKNKIAALALVLLLVLVSVSASALEAIDLNRDCTLTIEYEHEETPIPGAKFGVYRVADTDEYAKMTLTETFAKYAVQLEDLDQEAWQSLAVVLKGYVQRDAVTPTASGTTDAQGKIQLTLKPGLYLVFSDGQTTVGDETYVSDPFMVFLPAQDADTHEWVYTATASPKNTTPTIALKVLKVWDDKGFESIRPKEITVTLLRDGKPYQTVKLNKDNNWRYDWSGLDPDGGYEWSVVEEELKDYKPVITREGATFVITNTYREPDVVKKITGDKPSKTSEFIFLLKAKNPANPMPAGSVNGVKELKVTGAGGVNFEIEFKEPGTYVYTIEEKNTGISGYTYDTTVYTLTYTVTAVEGQEDFNVDLKIKDAAGKSHSKIEFTNKYASGGGGGGGGGDLPQTGLLWWPVPALLAAGLALVLIGIIRRKGNRDEE